ncbi:MAG: nucleotidyltransferase domain-containing protein [Spirochaetaceae bacterium]|nr:nucleotidyltransferase domain-containing protein [Spirochaetaceae bacterium]
MSARFSTEVLDRALRQKRKERERRRQDTLARLLDLLPAAPIALPEATIFGSILRPGAFDDRSDVDLAIPPVAPRSYFDLKSYLEDGLCRVVDLVDLDGCHFAAAIARDGLKWKSPAELRA